MVPLFIAAALAYGAASFFYGAVQANDASAQGEKKSWPRWILLGAGLLHFCFIGTQSAAGAHPFESIYLALSLGSFTAVVGYLIISNKDRPMRGLGASLAPAALVTMTLSWAVDFDLAEGEAVIAGSRELLSVHIGLATLGLAVFSLAAGVAGLYLAMRRRLRQKVFRPGEEKQGLSLEGLERLHFWLVVIALPIFTLAVATGGLVLVDDGGLAMLKERGIEILAAGVAWIASVAVLVSRIGLGLRGRRAAWLTITAFAAIVVIVISYGVRS